MLGLATLLYISLGSRIDLNPDFFLCLSLSTAEYKWHLIPAQPELFPENRASLIFKGLA